jgi:hypothetical protein
VFKEVGYVKKEGAFVVGSSISSNHFDSLEEVL